MKSILIEWDENEIKVAITPGIPMYEVLGALRLATIDAEDLTRRQMPKSRIKTKESR